MDNSHETIEGDAYTMVIRHIKPGERLSEHKVSAGTPETANWNQRLVASLELGNRPSGRSRQYMNSAAISVLCRRIMAIEWRRALRRTIPENYTVAHKPDMGLLRAKDAS